MKVIKKFKSINGKTYRTEAKCRRADYEYLKSLFVFDYSNEASGETNYPEEYSRKGCDAQFLDYGIKEQSTINKILGLIDNLLENGK